jgi:hypothetical protein
MIKKNFSSNSQDSGIRLALFSIGRPEIILLIKCHFQKSFTVCNNERLVVVGLCGELNLFHLHYIPSLLLLLITQRILSSILVRTTYIQA